MDFKGDTNINLLLKAGDHTAFVRIYNMHSKELYYFVKRYFKDDSICDDIIHDAFLNLWNSRARILDSHPISHYLFRITRNLVYKELKKQLTAATLFQNTLTELDQVQGSECVEKALFNKEYDNIYNLAIDTLPPQRKRIFRMSREEGLTYKEIAGDLKISTQTVKEHMSLAMKSIKDYIAREHDIILKAILILSLFYP